MNSRRTLRRVSWRHAILALLLVGLAAACPKKTPGVSVQPVAPAPVRPSETARAEQEKRPPAPGPAKEQPPERKPVIDADSRKKVDEALSRAERLLLLLAGRELTESQREERAAGATFITQARDALESGDPDRALVLAEKALVLVENLEQETR